MAGEWREVLLDDVTTEITVGFVGPMASEYVTAGIPFLRSKDVLPLRIDDSELKLISPAFHARLKKSSLTPGDVVIVRTGRPGACAVIPEKYPIANCSDLVIIRCGPLLDPHFLAYYVNSVAARHIEVHLVGAVQQHFNIGSARQMSLHLPDLVEQRGISEVLGALGDKIELNRQMNRTLEKIAHAIFKSWFVDFDPVVAKAEGRQPFGMSAETAKLFPDRFVDSELGPIPKGWQAGQVSDLLTLSRAALDPRRFPEEVFEHFSIPAFDQAQRPVKEQGRGIQSNKYIIRQGAILISKLNPGTPRVWWPTPCNTLRQICSTEFQVAEPRKGCPQEFIYCLLKSEDFTERFACMVTGTSNSHQRVKPQDLLNLEVIVPPEPVMGRLADAVAHLLSLSRTLGEQSASLASLRDTLLPPLLSGELRVKDAERMAGRAV
jgi:type I restriction enzyme S subunit